jgi:hypothetical protein
MEQTSLPEDNFGFYVASSDREVLSQVSELLRRKGCLGFADTSGRMHYLVDGRKGTAFAARSILDTTGYAIRLDGERRRLIDPVLEAAVSQTLASAGIAPHLKGHRYLRMMIMLSVREGIDPWPVSKTLYPAAATFFHTTSKKIERDVRYCIRLAGESLRQLTNSMAINVLKERTLRCSEDLSGYARKEGDADGVRMPMAGDNTIKPPDPMSQGV